MIKNSKVVIVGAGPAGLFCAYLLLEKGHEVEVYDQSSGVAKKFLIAGNGGLNLTHSEDLDLFARKYGKDEEFFRNILNDFSPDDLRKWCAKLGIETFIGSSGRVFPKEMSAGKMLTLWTQKLKSYDGFSLFLKHRLIKLTKDKELFFDNGIEEICVNANNIILAMGGASWKKTGSDGKWKSQLEALDVTVKRFQPMNCGFKRPWSDYFKKHGDHSFLKHVEVSFQGKSVKGDLMLTSYGIEGGVVYALSSFIRDELNLKKTATILIDLRPGLTVEEIVRKLGTRSKKITLSNLLRKALNFDKTTFMLLKELLMASDFENNELLAHKIKGLSLDLYASRPIDEAISTGGGVCFSQLNSNMELKAIEGIYFCGEMLDYEAPTGGYLLQGSFSTAWRVVEGITGSDSI